MDLLTAFVADAARQQINPSQKLSSDTRVAVLSDNEGRPQPPALSPLPQKNYNENMHNYMKQQIPNTYRYVAVLSMPVAAMFITISWKDNAILFKILITILIVIHVVLVSNFIEYSSK